MIRHSVTGQTFVDIALMRFYSVEKSRADILYAQLSRLADSGESIDDEYGNDFIVKRVEDRYFDILEIQWGCHGRNVRFGYNALSRSITNLGLYTEGWDGDDGYWVNLCGLTPNISNAVQAGFMMMALDGLDDVFKPLYKLHIKELSDDARKNIKP